MKIIDTNFLQFIGVTYKKLFETACQNYGIFSTLAAAKESCTRDSNCGGVYNFGCDNSPGYFSLCYASDGSYSHSANDCVYQKIGKLWSMFYIFLEITT